MGVLLSKPFSGHVDDKPTSSKPSVVCFAQTTLENDKTTRWLFTMAGFTALHGNLFFPGLTFTSAIELLTHS